ncbi:MAG TPA: FtsX-like permease family protein [Candidatus Wallbacteria bacterium]|nr:FtsX-like permease family protein [Candidatus Wallbacteria bacterium]
MTKLNRMLIREISKTKGQFFAAAAVIFFGISLFTSSFMSYYNLRDSVSSYYDRFKLLDYFAEARSITPEAINKIKALDGVESAIGRVTATIGAFIGKNDEKRVTLKLISVPDSGRAGINDLQMLSGSYFDTGAKELCLLSDKFAKGWNLKRGSALKALINLKIFEFKVSGTVASPEYLIVVRGPFSMLSNDFGIIYVKESTAQKMLGYDNSYNEVHVRFHKNADRGAVIDKIEKLLKPYGFMNGVERKKYFGYMIINDEINHLEKTAIIFPTVFLLVAAMIIYIMQKRIINNQRTLIGVMKAFGYTDTAILWYYVKNSLVISLAGSAPAVLAGYQLGKLMGIAYNQVFSIPDMKIEMSWGVAFAGIGVSTMFCLLAGYNSARRVLKIQPAQAMRVEAPETGKNVFLEKIGFLWRRMSFSAKMIVRNLFRNPQRSFLTITGVAATVMFFMISMFFLDSIDFAFTKQFFDFQRQDFKVNFTKPVSYYDALDIQSMRGVTKVEPLTEIAVEIIKDWVKKDTVLVGAAENTAFYRLINERDERRELPEHGILVSQMIAEKFPVKIGDIVTVKAFVGNLKVKESSKEIKKKMRVVGIAKQYAGINCFVSMKTMREFMDEGKFVTSLLLKVERGMKSYVRSELLKINAVDSVEGRVDAFDGFMEQMKFMKIFVGVMVSFGTVMGFAIIFNSTIINIMERSRELASLKVLGYMTGEIQALLFIENLILSVIAIIPGVVIGKAMCHFINGQFSNEMFSLAVIIYPRTYIIAFLSVFICATLAQLANTSNIKGLDMVEVLKSRE